MAARTRWSTGPMLSSRAAISFGCARSSARPRAVAPISSATARAVDSSRPVRTTSRPRAAYARAISRPMPRVPPTMTTLPSATFALPPVVRWHCTEHRPRLRGVAERAGRTALSVVDDDVPRRLRAERERRGISLRELARRLDISPSAISQIETGRARPSVATLWAIVTELGMSLDDLFAPERGEAAATRLPVVSAEAREALQLATGVRWERLTADPDPDVDFIWVVYEAGGSSSPDDAMIRHAGREYGLVMSGLLEVTVGFERTVLGPGDSSSFDSTTPPGLRTAGDEPGTGVWVVVGRRADARTDGVAGA